MAGIKIIATGKCLPQKVVTNDDLSKIMDTSDEWITTRSGIKQRHYCTTETNLDLAYGAASQALERANIDKEKVSLLIVATFTPDQATPSLACRLHEKLELPKSTIAFDLSAACSGFIYSLTVANDMLKSRPGTYALVLGSEKISPHMAEEDRATRILFGDGAGCAVLEYSESGSFDSILGTEADDHILYCNNTPEDQFLFMEGKKVFTYAVKRMTMSAKAMLEKRNITLDDVDYVVCHQANARIISSVIKHLEADEKKFFINVDRYGNTSAACIPLALDDMQEQGLLKRGMKLLFVIFGAGFTYGAAYIEF